MTTTVYNVASYLKRRNLASMVFAMLMLAMVPNAAAQMPLECGSLNNAYGPYDYTNPVHRRHQLPIVERAHFDGGMRNLQGHARNGIMNMRADLDYTLRAFPNHHAALYTTIRYVLSDDPRHRRKMPYSMECYLMRAKAMQPKDGKVSLLTGIYYSRINRIEEAKKEFQDAVRLMPDSAEVHYNIGLVLAKSGDYAEARKHAHKAYELGYPLPGLRNILKRAGEWDAPPS